MCACDICTYFYITFTCCVDMNNHAESSLQIAPWLQHGFAWHAWNSRSTPGFHQEWHTFAVELGSQHLLPGSPCAAAVRALREHCLWKVWDPLVKSGGKGGLLLVARLSRHLKFQENKSSQFCLQGTFWEMIVLISFGFFAGTFQAVVAPTMLRLWRGESIWKRDWQL